jgi:hypothetical protein
MSEEHAVILVYSTGHALKAERVLQGTDVECKLIPVPRHLSSDCGVCVRIERDEKQRAGQALRASGMEIEGIHDI